MSRCSASSTSEAWALCTSVHEPHTCCQRRAAQKLEVRQHVLRPRLETARLLKTVQLLRSAPFLIAQVPVFLSSLFLFNLCLKPTICHLPADHSQTAMTPPISSFISRTLALVMLLSVLLPQPRLACARPVQPRSNLYAAALLPDVLEFRSAPSDTLLYHRFRLAALLAPLHVRQEDVRLVLGRLTAPTRDMILRQMRARHTGQHFIPLYKDGNGHKVYAMELGRPSSVYSTTARNSFQGRNGEKRFALLGVSTDSPTALTLYRGPPRQPTRPAVSIYGLIEVSGAPPNMISDITNVHSGLLGSESLARFLSP